MNKQDQSDIQIHLNRYVNPQYSIPLAIAGICGATLGFYRSYKQVNYLRLFTKSLMNAHQLNPFERTPKGNMLTFINGKLKCDNNLQPIDTHFGIKPTQDTSLGIFRQVEVFQQAAREKQGRWVNIDETNQAFQEKYSLLQNKIFSKGQLSIGNNKLSEQLLVSLAKGNSNLIPFNLNEINAFQTQLIQNQQKKYENLQNDPARFMQLFKELKEEDELLFNQFPFFYGQQTNKHIFQDGNYIYLMDKQSELNNGDVRISFHEINQIFDLTILAAKNDEFLTNYELKELSNKNLHVTIIIGSKEQVINLGTINFIKEGLIPKQQFIKSILSQVENNQKYYALAYAFIIYILYQYIISEIGDTLTTGASYSLKYLLANSKQNDLFSLNYKDIYINNPFYKHTYKVSLCYSLFHIGSIMLFLHKRRLFAITFPFIFLQLSYGYQEKIQFDDRILKEAELYKEILLKDKLNFKINN